jgi:DNA repair protein RecO (recombination protein O)
MAIEKTKAFVLKTLPYRESSGIFYLLTERHGLVHGLAKGIRKKKAGASFLERGFLIETLIYIKPHRELHTLANIEMMDYYPRIRNDLVKGAVRDAAFETILASLSSEFPAPELFSLVGEFLSALDRRSGKFPALLWNFYGSFSHLMGFGINDKQCISCKNELPIAGNLYLIIEKGGFACDHCAEVKDHRKAFPVTALEFFPGRNRGRSHASHPTISDAEQRRITRLIASYCQYHCDTKSDLKALTFLESLLFTNQTE